MAKLPLSSKGPGFHPIDLSNHFVTIFYSHFFDLPLHSLGRTRRQLHCIFLLHKHATTCVCAHKTWQHFSDKTFLCWEMHVWVDWYILLKFIFFKSFNSKTKQNVSLWGKYISFELSFLRFISFTKDLKKTQHFELTQNNSLLLPHPWAFWFDQRAEKSAILT